MNEFSLLFLFMLALATTVQLWLLKRQRVHVATHRQAVPKEFEQAVSLEAHQKAADYTRAKTGVTSIELIYGTILLILWTLGGGLQLLDNIWRSFELSPLLTGTGFMLTVFLAMSLLELPFSLYRTFNLEQRFGFNRNTPKLFIIDSLKQVLLMLLIGGPFAALVLWLMSPSEADSGRLARENWWLYVWSVWMGFSLLMMWAYPAIIAPLFNKFNPLEDSALEQRIRQLLERCGFAYQGVFVMDGSRRSSHGNAYFTGLGNNKRIVFFDTLLKSLKPEEIEAVLAHELGHFRRKHVLKHMLVMAAMSFISLLILGALIEKDWFYTELGMSQPSLHAGLLLFLLIMPVFTFFIQPLMARTMRKHEFEADDFAAEQADANHLISALVKLYEENASTLTPDPLFSAFHDSHPPAPVRIAHLSAKT
ncbi:MAG: M48 family metallopeptidase [Gammaproteobacteria bacterium]|nr:M48 family metallopeptidase [Gammaproteobacteria bacterium]